MSLEQAELDHWDELSSDSGISATYNGSPVTVVRGSSNTTRVNSTGMEFSTQDNDFLFRSSDLDAIGEFPPKPNSEIVITSYDGDEVKYETVKRGGERCYRISKHRIICRVFTSEVLNA